MKILIAKNKILEITVEKKDGEVKQIGKVINSDKFDEEYLLDESKIIVFNKHFDNQSNEYFCNAISCELEIMEDISFSSIEDLKEQGAEIKEIPFDEIEEEKEKEVKKKIKKEKAEKKVAEEIAEDIVEQEEVNKKEKRNLETYTKDNKNREEIFEENIKRKVISEGIYIDRSIVVRCKGEKVLQASKMFSEALSILKFSHPFQWGIIYSLDRVFLDENDELSSEIDTFGVTEDTIYINTHFCVTRTLAEVIFILAHEAGHIVLSHSARIGNRNHDLWNIAGDLIINKMLCEEFEITPNKKGKVKSTKSNNEYEIEFALTGLYDERIDLKKDTTESVYNELLNEEENRQNFKNQKDNQQQEGGQGSNNSNGGSGNGNNNDNQDKKEQEQQQGGGDNNENNENEENNKKQQNGNGKQDKNKKQGEEKQNGSESDENKKGKEEQQGEEKGQGNGKKKVIFRGKEIEVDIKKVRDVKENESDRGKTEAQKERICKRIIESGINAVSNERLAGDGKGMMERIYDEMEACKNAVKWRTVLEHKLRKGIDKKKTWLVQPRQKITVPEYIGRGSSKENNKLMCLIAVDSSGSISNEDLKLCEGVLHDLFNKYKVEGRVIYWNDGVSNGEDFKDFKEFRKVKPIGSGGTDCNCVFEYIKKEYKESIDAILIFTDGCFGAVKSDYRRIGKNTVWVMTKENYTKFKEPFGMKALIDI